jgi:WD40 repeat protein
MASVGGDDDTLRLWDTATGDPLGPPLAVHGFDVAFSPDGDVLAVAAYPTLISLWDTHSWQNIGELRAGPATGSFFKLAFSPDGRYIAATTSGSLWVWNTETQEPAGPPLADGGDGLAFGPHSSTLAYVDADGSVAFRDLATGTAVGEPISTQQNGVDSLAFSPDGRVLAVGGRDGTLRFWDVDTREPIGEPLPAHGGGVSRVAFTPDGHLLASVGADDAGRLWSVAFPTDPRAAVCATAGSPLSSAEWHRYLEGEAYVDACRDR